MNTRTPAQRNLQQKESAAIRLLSLKTGAAPYLGISYWSLRALIERGEIPIVRMGRRILVDIEDLNSWIERNKEQL